MKTVFNWKLTAIATMALTLACSASAQEAVKGAEWARPGVDWSQYEKVLVKPLDISDVKVLKPAWESDNTEDWSFSPGVGQEIQKLYMENLAAQLGKGYEVVDMAGEGVLQLEVELLSITPYTKPGAKAEPGNEVSTLGSGDVVVSAELRDSMSGSLLFFVEGERQIGTEYRELSPENHRKNLEKTFTMWGQRLREELDEAHAW